jgi:hypothetical protein
MFTFRKMFYIPDIGIDDSTQAIIVVFIFNNNDIEIRFRDCVCSMFAYKVRYKRGFEISFVIFVVDIINF